MCHLSEPILMSVLQPDKPLSARHMRCRFQHPSSAPGLVGADTDTQVPCSLAQTDTSFHRIAPDRIPAIRGALSSPNSHSAPSLAVTCFVTHYRKLIVRPMPASLRSTSTAIDARSCGKRPVLTRATRIPYGARHANGQHRLGASATSSQPEGLARVVRDALYGRRARFAALPQE